MPCSPKSLSQPLLQLSTPNEYSKVLLKSSVSFIYICIILKSFSMLTLKGTLNSILRLKGIKRSPADDAAALSSSFSLLRNAYISGILLDLPFLLVYRQQWMKWMVKILRNIRKKPERTDYVSCDLKSEWVRHAEPCLRCNLKSKWVRQGTRIKGDDGL